MLFRSNLIVDSETDEIMFTELKGDEPASVPANIKVIVDSLIGVNIKESTLISQKIAAESSQDKRAYLITSLYYDALLGIQEYK